MILAVRADCRNTAIAGPRTRPSGIVLACLLPYIIPRKPISHSRWPNRIQQASCATRRWNHRIIDNTLVIVLGGDWLLTAASRRPHVLDEAYAALPDVNRISYDCSELGRMGSALITPAGCNSKAG